MKGYHNKTRPLVVAATIEWFHTPPGYQPKAQGGSD